MLFFPVSYKVTYFYFPYFETQWIDFFVIFFLLRNYEISEALTIHKIGISEKKIPLFNHINSGVSNIHSKTQRNLAHFIKYSIHIHSASLSKKQILFATHSLYKLKKFLFIIWIKQRLWY